MTSLNPIPDDLFIGKGLSASWCHRQTLVSPPVVGFRIERRLSLATRKVQRLEGEVEAKVARRAHAHRFEKRYRSDIKAPSTLSVLSRTIPGACAASFGFLDAIVKNAAATDRLAVPRPGDEGL